MKLDTSRLLLLAVATAVAGGVVAFSGSRRRKHRTARLDDHRSQIGSWENEGGNLTPVVTHVDPVVAPTYRATIRPGLFAHSTSLWRSDWPRFPNDPPHPKVIPCDIP
jgi:hypothetical protein